jgi:hypothetical protein
MNVMQDPPSPPQPPSPPTPPTPPTPPIAPSAPGTPVVTGDGQGFVIIPGPDGNLDRISFNGRQLVITRKDGATQTVAIDRVVPSGAVDIVQAFGATLLLMVIGLPIARAIARLIDRRSAAPHVPKDVADRMQHMEQTLDDVALQVERISEAQRFTSRLLADERAEAVPVTRDASR